MSVENSAWSGVFLGAAPFETVAALVILTAVIAGFRWLSQPGLSLPDRRFLSRLVYVGWALVVTVLLVAAVSAAQHSQERSRQEEKPGAPALRSVPYEQAERARPVHGELRTTRQLASERDRNSLIAKRSHQDSPVELQRFHIACCPEIQPPADEVITQPLDGRSSASHRVAGAA